MTPLRTLLRLALPLLVMAPGAALAHTGVGETSGFAYGFGHPLGGLDHFLAMVLVGVFAWQLGGKAIWLVPAAFVLVMVAGGLLGVAGFDLPYVEVGIALSIVVIGAIVAFGVKAPVAVAMAIVGLFAIFHGHAHGAEMPAETSSFAYAAGFALATGLLHILGIGIGALIGAASGAQSGLVTRAAGGLASVAGLGILFGIV